MPSKIASKRYKVSIELPFGPLGTMDDAAVLKKRVKAKAPKIVFTTTTKSRAGYTFKGKLSYAKAFSVPASAVKQVLQAKVPGSKVVVTKI